jgi:hypothetical protein
MSFKEIEISNFSGLQSSNRLPDKSAAQILLNLDVRGKKGDLEVRNGYAQLYGRPEDTAVARGYFTAIDYLDVENFVVPSPLTEVTVEVAKGSLALLSGSNLVVDGNFDINPPANWDVSDPTITFPSGYADFTNVPNGSILATATAPLTAGQKYRLTFNIADRSAGGVQIYLTSPLNYDGNIATSTMNWTTNGNHCVDFTCSAEEEGINFRAFGAGTSNTFKLTNVVIYLLSEIKMPLVFASHTGSALSVAWDNLTKTYSTIISSVGATTNKYKIVLQSTLETYPGSAVHPTASNALAGWIIYNITRSDYAQIITSGTDTNGVYISKLDHTWAANDVILIMRSFIPYEYLSEMGTNVLAADVVSHKVLNDLVIGYGGQANRISLTVGFRQDYLNIGSCSFGSFTTTAGGELETATKNNGLILTSYFPEKSRVVVGLTTVADTATPLAQPSDYAVKAVIETDGFNLFDLGDIGLQSISAANTSLKHDIKILLGTDSRFISNIYLYFRQTATGSFNLFSTIPYRSSTRIPSFNLNAQGRLELNKVTELHATTENAAGTSTATDANALDGWEIYDNQGGMSLSSIASPGAPWVAPTPTAVSQYIIQLDTGADPGATLRRGYVVLRKLIAGIKHKGTYTVSFWLNSSKASGYNFQVYFGDSSFNAKSYTFGAVGAITSTVTQYTFNVTVDGEASSYYLYLFLSPDGFPYTYFDYTELFYFDQLSISEEIKITSDTAISTELQDDLGYVSTGLYAKSWDNVIISAGKTLLVNPYFDKRYLNKVFFSPFSGSGAPMYAVILPANYYDLENFDGNDVVGLEVLPNMDFFVLRRNSTQILDGDTGATRSVELGRGCINRATIVNYGDRIIWCGENDIHLSNGVEVIDITDGTIRTTYRGISDKSGLVATREERDNAYRFYNGSVGGSEREYLFTKKGWIENKRDSIPSKYALSKSGTVYFVKTGVYNATTNAGAGIVYKDGADTLHTDANVGIAFNWKSNPFDVQLLGENVKDNSRFFLKAIGVRSVYNVAAGSVALKIYKDDNADSEAASADQSITFTGNSFRRQLLITQSCKRFAIGVSGTLLAPDAGFSLASITLEYAVLNIGKWANG